MQTESNSSSDCITGFVPLCSTTREPVTQILFINISIINININISICLSIHRLSVSLLTMFMTFISICVYIKYCTEIGCNPSGINKGTYVCMSQLLLNTIIKIYQILYSLLL